MKKVRKILPLSSFDIPGMETWLEEQANNGLFPVFLDAWATFTTDGVPGTRFRFEPRGKTGREPSSEQLDLYGNAGWKYAFSVGGAYFLFYTTDPNAPELYNDYQSRGLSLERLEKKCLSYRRTSTALYSILGILLIWALFFYQSKYDAQPDVLAKLPLLLVQLFDPYILIFLLLALFLWKRTRRDISILQQTCKSLNEEQAPPPSPGPSKRIIMEHKITLALIPVLLVLLIVRGIGDRGGLRIPVEEFSRPYIALQELEQVEIEDFLTLFGPSHFHEDENQAEYHFSLLAPVWYEVSQDGYATEEKDYQGFSPNPEADDRYELRYSPNLETVRMQLLIPALARPVAEAQMDSYRLVNLRWSYEDIIYPDLDFVIIADEPEGIWQMAALGKGSKIAVFRYGGQEDLRDHLELLSTLVK